MSDKLIEKSSFGMDKLPVNIASLSYKQYSYDRPELLEHLHQKADELDLNDGLFYMVLVDLSGSSSTKSKMNDDTQYCNWLNSFTKISTDSLNFQPIDTTMHIGTCGDGSLFLFRNFDDILKWKSILYKMCSDHNEELMRKQESHPYYFKIIVHLGDVHFSKQDDSNRSFVIDVIFGIEKQFSKDDFGITEAVREALMPEINSGRFHVEKITNYMGSDKIEFSLWKLFEK